MYSSGHSAIPYIGPLRMQGAAERVLEQPYGLSLCNQGILTVLLDAIARQALEARASINLLG